MLTDNPTAPLILVVEDDNSHALLIQRSFEDVPEEYRLERVGTIRAAKAATEQNAHSLVLTDYKLPDGDGSEMVALAAGACPVIMMTSHGNEQIAVEAMKIGAQDYIVKSAEAFEALPRTVAMALKVWSLIQSRRQTDKAILRAKTDWERTFDAVPDLISIIDINHTITRVNRSMANRCGLTVEEIVGRKCYEAVHGLLDAPSCCPSVAMFLDGRMHNSEIEEKRLNGIFDVTVSPLLDEEGRVTSYVHVMRDITEHRKTEELVRQRLKLRDIAPESSIYELMQATLDTCEHLTESSIGFFHLVDDDQLNLTLQVWSTNTLAIMCSSEGQDKHYPISQAGVWVECFHTREPVIHNDYANLPNRKGMPSGHAPLIRELTVPVVVNDKVISIIGVGNKASPYTQHDIYIVKQFVTFATEVLGRKRATIALKESEIRMRTLVQTIPDLIWLKDADGVYIGCNRVFERFFGAQESDIIGKTDYDFVDRELADFFREHDRKAMAARGPISNEEWVTFADNGQRALLDTIKTPMYDSEGKLIGVLGIAHDITKRKQAEENSLEMERKFQQTQKLESLGVLSGGIAHDFNNILTVILGHCYMAREDFIPEQEYKAAFQKIETAGNRAADLCRQMLTYAGKSPMERTRVNLWLLVDEVVKMLQAAIKKNVSIELDLKRVVPEILGDTGQIQQIIMNLIINAAEAIGANNGIIRVALTRVIVEADHTARDTFGTDIPAGGYVCLEVTDTGCGMDEETQKRIFEPFFTTKFTGRGLGMSAIQGIVKSHDAILQLTSTPGVGTTFKVFFPIPAASDYSETTSTESAPSEKASGTILLVDDEQTLRVLGATLLRALGFSAICASNGLEALEMYRERGNEIDVILLDMVMPVMGGIEAYHELRKISPTVPIIICSGYGVESVEQVTNNDPNAGFVHKPYKPKELRDVIVKMMKNGQFDRCDLQVPLAS